MPTELRNRLNAVFTDEPWRAVVQAQTDAQVPANVAYGPRMADVKTITVHQTSGWHPRANGRNMFTTHFIGNPPDRFTTQLFISGDGTVMQGMDFTRVSWHGNGVNMTSIGVETAHPYGNYGGNHLIGPWSETRSRLDNTRVPLRRMTDNEWFPLSGNDTMDAAEDDDLPGLKFWARGAGFSEVVVGLWTTPRFNGPWRNTVRVPECLFNEQQYRAWALFARWACEEFLIPRNFSLYPSKARKAGIGDDTGAHSMLSDAVRFREIVLADEGLSRSPQTFGLPAATVPPTAESLENAHRTGRTPATNPAVNTRWTSLFNVFRGFHGHGYSGDSIAPHEDHDCPGPLFDWHRFARETWDWWWWPFDYTATTPDTAVDARPYSLVTRNGNTPLKEYYWDQSLLTVLARRRPGIHGDHGSPATFELPNRSRVYALANGELVAARFPTEGTGVSLAFMLVRHEVFHELDRRPPNPTATPPVFANRIDYDREPTTVYSLYMHLGHPQGMDFERVAGENPDWLNRLLTRKKECELGLRFRTSTQGTAISNATWNGRPPGTPRRATVHEGWTADNAALGTFLAQLRGGQVATAPRDANTMPLRVLLGDYLGHVGNIGSGRRGVRVEVFANDAIADFTGLDTSGTTNDWQAPTAPGDPVVRYRSEWARVPTNAEALRLSLAGVTDLSQVNWWRDVAPATLGAGIANDAHLDPFGLVHHYDPLTFLPWLNARTWRSEWPKYRATDPAGVPARPRPR